MVEVNRLQKESAQKLAPTLLRRLQDVANDRGSHWG